MCPPLRCARATARVALTLLLAVAAACGDRAAPTDPSTDPSGADSIPVPTIAREFRGLWIATVSNIDWPSQVGASPEAQRAELVTILDRARSAGFNAVILQVRAAGDALYPSALEPWSRALTGVQGTDPGWDPLAFAVTEAHARGLELHAWFNPFRAGNLADTARLASSHFAKRRPDLARTYCTQRWFDPSAAAVHDHVMAVIRDVVNRYAIDAVHLDDYFYPYPDSRCPGLDFPDSAAYAQHVTAGGTLSRGDWRRDNVNRFVERLYREVHATSPPTRVGISPFGIWRPGNPVGVVGLDAYASLYADSRLWLQRGWVDYLAPQLYWPIASSGQSFTALLDWWSAVNPLGRHLWPGLAAYRVADGTSSAYASGEILAQVAATRQRAGASGGPSGVVLYNTSALVQNRDGLATRLATTTFAAPALVPATPWLDGTRPAAPIVDVSPAIGAAGARTVAIAPADGEPLAWWLVRARSRGAGDGTWSQRLLPATVRTTELASDVDAVVLTAIDRAGNASADVVRRVPND